MTIIPILQATLANIRALKMSLETIETKDIANYTLALAEAFDALENTRNNDSSGAHCNQAIMLISDGKFKKSIRWGRDEEFKFC